MRRNVPAAELDPRFSAPAAKPTAWADALALLEQAKIYWLTTVRPDGRPHVTSLFAVWLDDAFYFCTGDTERKAKNLARTAHCVITTGCHVDEGLDVVIEGDAVKVTEEARLRRLAELWKSKYNWNWKVRGGAFRGDDGNAATVYEVAPTMAFGFAKGATPGQTRWRF
jgi:general stress protein 26